MGGGKETKRERKRERTGCSYSVKLTELGVVDQTCSAVGPALWETEARESLKSLSSRPT